MKKAAALSRVFSCLFPRLFLFVGMRESRWTVMIERPIRIIIPVDFDSKYRPARTSTRMELNMAETKQWGTNRTKLVASASKSPKTKREKINNELTNSLKFQLGMSGGWRCWTTIKRLQYYRRSWPRCIPLGFSNEDAQNARDSQSRKLTEPNFSGHEFRRLTRWRAQHPTTVSREEKKYTKSQWEKNTFFHCSWK